MDALVPNERGIVPTAMRWSNGRDIVPSAGTTVLWQTCAVIHMLCDAHTRVVVTWLCSQSGSQGGSAADGTPPQDEEASTATAHGNPAGQHQHNDAASPLAAAAAAVPTQSGSRDAVRGAHEGVGADRNGSAGAADVAVVQEVGRGGGSSVNGAEVVAGEGGVQGGGGVQGAGVAEKASQEEEFKPKAPWWSKERDEEIEAELAHRRGVKSAEVRVGFGSITRTG